MSECGDEKIGSYPEGLQELPEGGCAEALYIHVPFCVRKCAYCDFYSQASPAAGTMEQYVQTVLNEAVAWRRRLGEQRLGIRTVFVGGGTPTCLPPTLMQRLICGLRDALRLNQVEEWTVEANPATVDTSYCRLLRDEGVDRLSIGVQSFNDEELVRLGRIHTAAEAERTVEIARDAGFERLSIDLIYGIPGQGESGWRRTLERVWALKLEHVSCYCLSYEAGTPLTRQREAGAVEGAGEDEELALFRMAGRMLAEAGLERYEISNYARLGQECRHNLTYWRGGDYIGIGPAAASHLAGCRWRTPGDLSRWNQMVGSGDWAGDEFERLSLRQRASELAMLMLRLREGIDYDIFARRLGIDVRQTFADELQRLEKTGVIRLNTQNAVLTEHGVEIADSAALEFFA